mmetsp:Transcript_6569/g.22626  ORF Transcript_6569/g.22626 Transcript_6569/m.22626 type:complete len:124 (+) Transcript_6569:65-436(+)
MDARGVTVNGGVSRVVAARSRVAGCCTSRAGRVASGGLRNNGLTTTGAAARRARRASLVAVRAEEPKGGLSRDSEPEEYWMDKNTKEGKSPWKDPMALIGVFGLLSPFLILGVAIASGYVELN